MFHPDVCGEVLLEAESTLAVSALVLALLLVDSKFVALQVRPHPENVAALLAREPLRRLRGGVQQIANVHPVARRALPR